MKKTYLFVAAVAAVAIGCTNEMLDTSYENAISEARLKGEHPLVFNAYVGNSMRQTRTVLENEQYATDNDHVEAEFYTYYDYSSGSSVPFEAIQDAYGIFAYVYRGTEDMNDYFPAYYSGSGEVYSSSEWYTDVITSPSTKAITPNFMYNSMIFGSHNYLYDYNETEGGYYDTSNGANYKELTMYWPTADYSNSEAPKISFFAYYPHVNPYHPDYNSPRNSLHISSEAQSGAPILDYKVATYADDLIPIDLMVAAPVLDKTYDTADGADNNISLNFGHLLSAVHVNLHYKSDNSSGTEPTFYFTKLSLQGADGSGKVTPKSMFRNRGRFNMGQGGWNCTGYDPLDLLSSSWLLNAKHDDGGSYVDGFVPNNADTWYSLFGSNPLGPNESSSPNPNYYETSDWTDGTGYNEEMLKQSDDQHGFMFIIPNYDAKTLLLDLAYTVDYGGGKIENIEVQKLIDNNTSGPEFEPGKVYYLTIEIEKKSMTFSCDINIHNWTWGMP
jgi:hypothetical protein